MDHVDHGRVGAVPLTEKSSRPRNSSKLSAAERLALVQRIAERLADSENLSEVLATVVWSANEALGAAAITVGLVSEDRSSLVTLVSVGMSPRTEELLSKPVPLAGGIPASSVLGNGEPLFWSSLEERDRAYPEYKDFPSEHESWAVLPLVVHGTAIGVISLGWGDRRRFSRADAALLKLLAHQCAVAVDRARLQEIERGERETLELLGEGTRLMVSALDPDRVVERLVRLAVPRLAPWCAVYVAERHRLTRVAGETAEGATSSDELAADAASEHRLRCGLGGQLQDGSDSDGLRLAPRDGAGYLHPASGRAHLECSLDRACRTGHGGRQRDRGDEPCLRRVGRVASCPGAIRGGGSRRAGRRGSLERPALPEGTAHRVVADPGTAAERGPVHPGIRDRRPPLALWRTGCRRLVRHLSHGVGRLLGGRGRRRGSRHSCRLPHGAASQLRSGSGGGRQPAEHDPSRPRVVDDRGRSSELRDRRLRNLDTG